MAIKFACTRCGRQYDVGDDLAGKRVKCKECGEIVSIPPQDVMVISATEVLDGDRERPAAGGGALAPGAAEGAMSEVAAWAARVLAEVNKVFIGQHDLVRGVLVALLA